MSTRFAQFTKPVTLVWGMGGRCFKPTLARRMAQLFPDASIIEVPGSKTFVALNEPAAVINAISTVGAHHG
ncbi:haloalkane dehalogenase [Mycobacterium marinum]|nr:haloalkane dehalogenase [Mycobacterium marinum]